MIVTDFLIDQTTKEWIVKDGDLVIGDATRQAQGIILMVGKGEIKQYLDLGVGLFTFLHDEGPEELYRSIRQEYAKDNMRTTDIQVTGEKIIVEASF